MKNLFIIFLIFFLSNCTKSKTVLICGDHICINKAEAKQYFEENLTIEVKIINKKEKKNFDLVQLNLDQEENGEKRVSLYSKSETSKELKTLSEDEIKIIKKKIKKNKKIAKKEEKKELLIDKKEKTKSLNEDFFKIGVNKKRKNVVDVCTILEKCSIDEISKYLLKQGKKKDFPDITARQ